MKKTPIILLLVLSLSLQWVSAQSENAEQLISSLLNEAKSSAVKTGFKLKITDRSNRSHQTSGNFTIKGSKFVLDMEDMKVWFDGKTQWNYVADQNEVSITEPTEKELAETNPMAILSGYKTKSHIRFGTKKLENGNYNIEMTPKSRDQEIIKIVVLLNKTTNHLVSLQISNKNGTTYLLSLSGYVGGVKVPDATFVFNPSKYKSANINDLR